MKHGSLFSGIGGFDLAAEWMGWQNVWHCDIDPEARRVLKLRFPGSRLIDEAMDISQDADFLDILTAGFPCQPWSENGKKQGPNDTRNQWPATKRAISITQPRWFVGENVPGLITWRDGEYLSRIEADLKEIGYTVWLVCIPALAVGAQHKRERLWIIAHNPAFGVQGVWAKRKQEPHPLDTAILPLRDRNGQWEVEPDLRRAHDGIPRRMDRLKLIGNAIVPQVAFQIFKTIEQYEKLKP
jgi:DNA (cytosine-5)-methyltransferase 1